MHFRNSEFTGDQEFCKKMLFQYCGPAPNGIRSGLAVTHMKMTQCGGAGLGPEPEQTKKDRIRESWQLPV